MSDATVKTVRSNLLESQNLLDYQAVTGINTASKAFNHAVGHALTLAIENDRLNAENVALRAQLQSIRDNLKGGAVCMKVVLEFMGQGELDLFDI